MLLLLELVVDLNLVIQNLQGLAQLADLRLHVPAMLLEKFAAFCQGRVA